MAKYLTTTKILLIVILLITSCKEDVPDWKSVFGKIDDDVSDYILYASNRKGGPLEISWNELYFLNVDTGEELQLTDKDEYENIVKFVYDSKNRKVIFTSLVPISRPFYYGLDIYSLDLETKEIINLTNTLAKIYSGIYSFPNNIPWHTDPEISTDGSKIIYVKMSELKWDINILPLDGQEEYTILSKTRASNQLSWKPRWSPDGSRILYESWVNNNWRISLMNSDGTDQKLVGNQASSQFGSWSLDGSQILFSAGGSLRRQNLYIADASGNNLRQITTGANCWWPAWSHSGNYIAYLALSFSDTSNGDIHIVNLDGNFNRTVTTIDDKITSISWSPQDSKILFESPSEHAKEIFMTDGTIIQQITIAGYSSRPQWININLK